MHSPTIKPIDVQPDSNPIVLTFHATVLSVYALSLSLFITMCCIEFIRYSSLRRAGLVYCS